MFDNEAAPYLCVDCNSQISVVTGERHQRTRQTWPMRNTSNGLLNALAASAFSSKMNIVKIIALGADRGAPLPPSVGAVSMNLSARSRTSASVLTTVGRLAVVLRDMGEDRQPHPRRGKGRRLRGGLDARLGGPSLLHLLHFSGRFYAYLSHIS